MPRPHRRAQPRRGDPGDGARRAEVQARGPTGERRGVGDCALAKRGLRVELASISSRVNASSARRPAPRARRSLSDMDVSRGSLDPGFAWARRPHHRPPGGRMLATLAVAVTAALGPPIALPELEHDVLTALGDDNRVGFAFGVLPGRRSAARTRQLRTAARGSPPPRRCSRRTRRPTWCSRACWSLRTRRDRRRVLAVPCADRRPDPRPEYGVGLADRVARVGLTCRASRSSRSTRASAAGRVTGGSSSSSAARARTTPTIVPPRPDLRRRRAAVDPGRRRLRQRHTCRGGGAQRRALAVDSGRRHPRRRRLRDPPRAGGRRRRRTPPRVGLLPSRRSPSTAPTSAKRCSTAAEPANVVGGVRHGARRHLLRRRRAELVLAQARGRSRKATLRFCPAPKEGLPRVRRRWRCRRRCR